MAALKREFPKNQGSVIFNNELGHEEAKSSENHDLYGAMAASFGKNAELLIDLDNGYYWDPLKQEVCEDTIHHGEKPVFNRKARRELNSEYRRMLRKERKEERSKWESLYHLTQLYTQKTQSDSQELPLASSDSPDTCPTESEQESIQNVNDTGKQNQSPIDQEESPAPLLDDSQLNPEASEIVDSQVDPEQAPVMPEGNTASESIDKSNANNEIDDLTKRIRKILSGFSTNGLLRFFLWVIREIGDEMADNFELRKKYLVSESAFTRDRSILLSDVLLFLLTMAGDNMNNEVYEYFKMNRDHPSTSAMVQRRGLLKAEGVEYFLERITSICLILCDNLPRISASDHALSRFSRFLSADGSGINVAYDPDNTETYVGGKNGRKGYNQYHLNSIRDSIHGMFVSNILQPVNQLNETGAAEEMIRSLQLATRCLFTADRGYGSLNLIETIRRKKNLDCLIRVKETWITETRNLPLSELDTVLTIHVVTTQRNIDKQRFKAGEAKYLSGKSKFGKYKKSQTWDYENETDVTFRVVRFQLDNGTWETLVTTLTSEEFSIEELKELYFKRWSNIENAFRTLKWDTHLSQMHCKLDNSSRQEVFARLAMHNIVSCIISIANNLEPIIRKLKGAETGKNTKDTPITKNSLIINRRFATHLVCDFLKNEDSISFDVIEMLLRYKVPVRSGRSFKRNMRIISFISFSYR